MLNMIDVLFTILTILLLLLIKSCYSIVAIVYFICITIYNMIFISHNDTIGYTFSIAIPIICFISLLWKYNTELYCSKPFFISMLLFAFCATKAFCATDALSMFIYMETSMLPMALMMLSENRDRHANVVYQYLTYTFISACLLLIAIIQINIDSKNYNFIPTRDWCYWLIALASAIKLPMFPFHYWVPIVHGKSSTICSILLATVCLKYSSLIIIRFLLPLPIFTQYIIIASMVSAICWLCKCSQDRERNLKTIFAYSSIIHMNLYLFIPLTTPDSKWFLYSLIAHSLTMLLAFIVADIIKGRTIISNKNWILVLIGTLCLMSIPGSIGFIAEICALYKANTMNSTITSLVLIFIIIFSYCIMGYIFKIKENVSNYRLIRLNKSQTVAIVLTITLIIVGGTVPFFKLL